MMRFSGVSPGKERSILFPGGPTAPVGLHGNKMPTPSAVFRTFHRWIRRVSGVGAKRIPKSLCLGDLDGRPQPPVVSFVRHLALLVCICTQLGCQSRLDQLAEEIASEENERQRIALRQIETEGLSAKAAFPAVMKALSDDDLEVRRLACRVFEVAAQEVRKNTPEEDLTEILDFDQLVTKLESNCDEASNSLRMSAAYALLAVSPENERARKILNEAMQRGDGGVIDRIGTLEPKAVWAVPTLTDILRKDRRAGHRRLAAKALGELGESNDEVLKQLKAAQADKDDRVRNAATKAVTTLNQAKQAKQPETG